MFAASILTSGIGVPEWLRPCGAGKSNFCSRILMEGRLGGSVVGRLPLAQGVIPGFGIESHIGLRAQSLPLSLCVSHE